MSTGTEVLKDRLAGLSAAEEFLDFFGVAYDPAVVHVNRLHILKRWHQYLEREHALIDALPETEVRERYSALLQRAYGDFVVSTARKEKVFKVFQDADGPRFSFSKLSATLPSRAKLS